MADAMTEREYENLVRRCEMLPRYKSLLTTYFNGSAGMLKVYDLVDTGPETLAMFAGWSESYAPRICYVAHFEAPGWCRVYRFDGKFIDVKSTASRKDVTIGSVMRAVKEDADRWLRRWLFQQQESARLR